MDKWTRAFYELKLEVTFHKKNGNEYQDFFSEVMEKCHPGDFQRVRPWGNVGDRKNDGYLRSERTLFQVYAPNEATASNMIAKIEEDFSGALPYWQRYFDNWIFVHNSPNGLGPDVLEKILEIHERHESIAATSWGYAELRRKAFDLSESDIASLLGPAPSQQDMLNLGYEDLKDILLTIADRGVAVSEQDFRSPSPEKLSANNLSANTQMMLKFGMWKAHLVGEFFDRWTDPNFGDNVAKNFKQKYEEYRAVGMIPDAIFGKLQEFAGGSRRGDSGHEAAVLAVLAYLFEQCDIFERSSEATSP